MRINPVQKFAIEQYPEQREWIGPFFLVLNTFIANVVAALKGQLTFAENIAGQEFLFDFTYQTAVAVFPIGFSWSMISRPVALEVVSALENGSPIIAAAAWQSVQSGNNDQVQLTDVVKMSSSGGISALTAGARYQIRVRVTP